MIALPYALKNLRCVGKGDRAHIRSLCALCPISRTGLLRTNFRKEKILVLHFKQSFASNVFLSDEALWILDIGHEEHKDLMCARSPFPTHRRFLSSQGRVIMRTQDPYVRMIALPYVSWPPTGAWRLSNTQRTYRGFCLTTKLSTASVGRRNYLLNEWYKKVKYEVQFSTIFN